MDTTAQLSQEDENAPIIEEEIGNDEVVIRVPFNPDRIKVLTKPYSIGQIIADLEDNGIDFDTEFQRLPGLWNNQQKSRFIESLLLRLPVPAFYFNEKEENNWEVVDGLQRVSTIKQFVIDNDLPLQNLEFLTEYNGSRYLDLPITLQKRITRFEITIYLIEKGTPVEVKYNLFKRINQGGLILTPQEIRHAINQGSPAELVADLVRGEDQWLNDEHIAHRRNHNGTITELWATEAGRAFRHATDYRIQSRRMEDRDFATRFVSFYLIPYTNYEPDLDSFLNKGMAKIRELDVAQISKLKTDFKEAMILAWDLFGNDAFRKRLNVEDQRKPINKALFEVLSVNFAKLSEKDRERLLQNGDEFKEELIALQNAADGKFLRSITQGTAQRETVDQRFRDIERIIHISINK